MNHLGIVFFLLIVKCANCAKILGIFTVPSKSTQILAETLLRGLAVKGHEVTMLSPYESKDLPKNYTKLPLPELWQLKDEHLSKTMINIHEISAFRKISVAFNFFGAVNEAFYNNANVKKLISLGKQFDVAIIGYLGIETFLAIAQNLAKYTIIFSTARSHPVTNEITKNPYPSSYFPITIPFSFLDEMNFVERLQNSLIYLLAVCFQRFNSHNLSGTLEKLSLNVSISSELYDRVSLVLLNTHYSIESTRWFKFVVSIWRNQTGDFKQFKDDAKDGVILYSLGSNVKSSDFDKETISGILKCFSKLSYQVLWKFEKNDVLDLPQNVKISDWLPQRDLLVHKNMKVFITHGGLSSTMETIYNGVPMIGIPLFGDQVGNVNDAVVKGYALSISPSDLSEDTLFEAIEEITRNPNYSDNIQKRSKIFRDQPMKPLDKAIYWVEYVLRHNGAFHLKTSASKLYWFQLYLLDVAAVILSCIILCVYAIRKLCRCCCKFLREKLFEPSSKRVRKSKIT